MNNESQWSQDEFEDYVARILIACFESKVRKNRVCDPSDRLTDERMAWVRNVGPYIPAKSRVLLGESLLAPEVSGFDTANDPLPMVGVVAWQPTAETAHKIDGAYIDMQTIRRVSQLGRNWRATAAGTNYESFVITAGNEGVRGFRTFFTVTSDGGIRLCEDKGAIDGDWSGKDMTLLRSSYAMNVTADEHYCWTISAHEKAAKARLGCMADEIKSLLYARSLPMSETGRKRPILHLVEAHRRRLKSGIDVDVTSFLRGQQVVEFGGTTFKVAPPQSLRGAISAKSERYYA